MEKGIKMIRLVVFLFGLLLISSCSKSAKDILGLAENATFTIYTFDETGSPAGSGSGFFIDEKGIPCQLCHKSIS